MNEITRETAFKLIVVNGLFVAAYFFLVNNVWRLKKRAIAAVIALAGALAVITGLH